MPLRTAAFCLLVLLCLSIATYAVLAYTLLPPGALVHPAMRESFELHRVALYVHVFASTVALTLGPFQFVTRWRAARPAWHRASGRLYLGLGVALGGSAGLVLAARAFGGPVAQTGFAGLALAWLGTGLLAWRAIRRGDTVEHRRWMLRNFALTFAAVTLRLWLPVLGLAGLSFEAAYPVVAWLSWVPNLMAVEWWRRRREGPR
jgi:uncharacterized membrane protein